MSETTSNARRRVEFDLPQASGADGEGGPPRHDPQSVEELLKGEDDDDSDEDDDIPEWQREWRRRRKKALLYTRCVKPGDWGIGGGGGES